MKIRLEMWGMARMTYLMNQEAKVEDKTGVQSPLQRQTLSELGASYCVLPLKGHHIKVLIAPLCRAKLSNSKRCYSTQPPSRLFNSLCGLASTKPARIDDTPASRIFIFTRDLRDNGHRRKCQQQKQMIAQLSAKHLNTSWLERFSRNIIVQYCWLEPLKLLIQFLAMLTFQKNFSSRQRE